MKKRRGQILILILLIVVVALAVGLSVASRNITNLRTSTQTEHSQRAFTAAEGGVEDVLSRLTQITTELSVAGRSEGTYQVTVGEIQATVNVKVNNEYEATIQPGEVGQVDLAGANGMVRVDWGKATDGALPASLELAMVSQAGVSYTQDRHYYPGGSPGDRRESGDLSSSSCVLPSSGYSKCVDVAVPANAKILRIKPFWEQASVKVYALAGSSIPVQTYDVASSASTDIGVTRKVQVVRTALPVLPAAFDYVLYSEGGISK